MLLQFLSSNTNIIILILLLSSIVYNSNNQKTKKNTKGKEVQEEQDKNNNQHLNLPSNHLPFYYSWPTALLDDDEQDGIELFDDDQVQDTTTGTNLDNSDANKKATTNFLKNKQEEKSNQNYCWGFEPYCDYKLKYSYSYQHASTTIIKNTSEEEDKDEDADVQVQPRTHYSMNPDHPIHSMSHKEQQQLWFQQADFGYINRFRDTLKWICEPNPTSTFSSSLKCSDGFEYCIGKNLIINLRHLLNRSEPIIYDMNVLHEGDLVGVNCQINTTNFHSQIHQYESFLTSWTPEIKHFTTTTTAKSSNYNFDNENGDCDVIITRPTYVMKLDAISNMYHHFCDFFNLYATLFVNSSSSSSSPVVNNNIFDQNINILLWRSWYRSNFESTFHAFTTHRLLDLNTFAGQKLCFKGELTFSLLPRMAAGLYYSTPLVPGFCNSGLFNAFSEFILHRLNISTAQSEPNLNQLRVTWLSRSTSFRQILNEDDIIQKLKLSNNNLVITKVIFSEAIDFIQQLHIIQNTDILIGIHGAGLTHMLFLPKWAVVFEIYHCEDPNCYSELARLAGLKYITWTNPKKLTVKDIKPDLDVPKYYQKFANYEFDPDETIRLVNKAVNYINTYQSNDQNHVRAKSANNNKIKSISNQQSKIPEEEEKEEGSSGNSKSHNSNDEL